MARNLSTDFTREILAGERTARFLIFLTLSHRDITNIRVVRDCTVEDPATLTSVPYRYGGNDYQSFLFDFAFVSDTDRTAATALRIQNVSRKIGQALDAISEPIRLSCMIFSSSDFALNGSKTLMLPVGSPTPEVEWPLAYIRNVEWDRVNVTADVKGFDVSRIPYPSIRATPANAPGLYI